MSIPGQLLLYAEMQKIRAEAKERPTLLFGNDGIHCEWAVTGNKYRKVRIFG